MLTLAQLIEKKLQKLIRVDFVAAQRGLGSEEAYSRSASGPHRIGLFSSQLLKLARQHLNVAATGHRYWADLIKAVADAQQELDKKIHEAISPSVEEIKELGYTSFHEPQEIRFRTRIQVADLLGHGTAVQYSMQKDSLEELFESPQITSCIKSNKNVTYAKSAHIGCKPFFCGDCFNFCSCACLQILKSLFLLLID